MKTPDLIHLLARDGMQDRSPDPTLMLVPALAVAAMMVGTILGFRADLSSAVLNPLMSVRFVLFAALGVVALRTALQLAQPGSEGPVPVRMLGLVAVAALILVALALATTPVDGWQMAATGKTIMICLIAIPLLSILPVVVVFNALHRGASVRPGLSGAMAGLAGSGMAATVYSLHCTEDSPLFYVTWYGLAILLVTVTSAVIGSRVLRW